MKHELVDLYDAIVNTHYMKDQENRRSKRGGRSRGSMPRVRTLRRGHIIDIDISGRC